MAIGTPDPTHDLPGPRPPYTHPLMPTHAAPPRNPTPAPHAVARGRALPLPGVPGDGGARQTFRGRFDDLDLLIGASRRCVCEWACSCCFCLGRTHGRRSHLDDPGFACWSTAPVRQAPRGCKRTWRGLRMPGSYCLRFEVYGFHTRKPLPGPSNGWF